MKKILSSILILILIGATFFGCNRKDDSKETVQSLEKQNEANNKTDKQKNEKKVKPIEIRWVTIGPGKQKDTDKVVEKANELLQEFIPGGKIKLDIWAGSDYMKKFDLAMAAQETIDVAWKGYMQSTSDNYNAGVFTPLDDLMTDKLREELPQFILDMGKINGEQVYIPKYEMHHWAEGLYTPKAAFDKYFDMDQYKKVMEDYKNEPVKLLTEEMYDLMENYMANAKEGGHLGSGFSPFMCRQSAGQKVVTGEPALTYTMPPVIRIPNNSDKWNTTVLNAYELEENITFFKKLADWREKGYLREDLVSLENPRQYENTNKEGNLIWFHNYVNADDPQTNKYLVEDRWKGDKDVILPMSSSIVASGTSDGLCIPSTANNPEISMKIIELMNIEEGKEFKNTLIFGLEGEHYKKINDNRIETIGYTGQATAENDYGLYNWAMGNVHKCYLTQGQKDNTYDYYKNMCDVSLKSPLLGYTEDMSEFEAEITAIRSLLSEYVRPFMCGYYTEEKYKEFLDKLHVAGVDDVIAETQKQVDAFLDNK